MKRTILYLCVGVLLCGCELAQPVRPADIHLPINATDITNAGNGWMTFRLNGNKYLYRAIDSTTSGGYTSRTEAIAAIPDDDDNTRNER